MRRALSILLRVALVGVCLAYIFWGLHPARLASALARFSPWRVLGLALLSCLSFLVLGWRLRFLARGEASLGLCLRASVLGVGVNNILPAKIGEAAKILYLRRQAGLSLPQVVGMVLWERFFDLNVLLLLILGTALMQGMSLSGPILAALVAVAWIALVVLHRRPSLARRLIGLVPILRAREFMLETYALLRGGLTPGFLLRLSVLSALSWAVYVLETAAGLWLVAGFDLTPMQVVTVFLITAVGVAVPSTPGALGVFEAAMAAGLAVYGIPKEEALAFGLVMHAVGFVPPALGAGLVLVESGMTLASLRRPEA